MNRKYNKNNQVALLCSLFFYIIISLCSPPLSAQNYIFRNFEDELQEPYINTINQTSDGAVWIGTGTGLYRFDGFNFEKHFVSDPKLNNFITCSYIHNNQLWFGHYDGTISKEENDTLTVIYSPTSNSPITHIERDREGLIWASTFSNGFIHIDPTSNNVTVKTAKELLTHNFKFISPKQMFVGAPDGLWLYTITPEKDVIPERRISSIPQSQISSIISLAEKNTLLVATQFNGIYTIDISKDNFVAKPIEIVDGEIIENIQDVIEDYNQNLWIATYGKGAIKLCKENSNSQYRTEQISQTSDFSSNNIKTLFEDREGIIWCGSYGNGLKHFINQPFTLKKYSKVTDDPNIYSIWTKGENRWVGIGDKLIKTDNSKVLAVFSTSAGLPNDKVTALFQREETLWLGTESNGIYQLDTKTNKGTKYNISDGFLENSITSITGIKDTVWIATKKGICKVNTKTNAQDWFTIEKGGLPHNMINHLILDSANRLWVSTPTNTMAFIFNDEVNKFQIHSSNKQFTIGPITQEINSTIWVGTHGAGVFKMNKDSIANLTTNEGLVSNYCYSIISDQTGNMWVTHKGGISKIRTDNFSVTPITEYADINKNCTFHKNAIAIDSNGEILMGSNEGMWIYNPQNNLKPNVVPILTIQSVDINGNKTELSDPISLKAGNYNLTIDFLGISLKTPKNVWYKYQLQGFDEEPIHTQQTSVTYKNLKHGKYTFAVSASTDDESNSSDPVSFSIKIETPFWKLWWFYAVVSSAIILMVALSIAQREYTHKAEKSKLQSEVKSKGEELIEKNLLLNERQELIVQQNKELKIYQNYLEKLVEDRTRELVIAKNRAEESDRLKTAFLNNISHEIRTPLHAICGFSNFLDDATFSDKEKSQFVKTISQNAAELLHMVDEIIGVSLIEANQNILAEEPFVVQSLLEELEILFLEKNKKLIHLEFVKPSEEDARLTLLYDPLRIRHVFTHLIDNALKFTEKGEILFGYKVKYDQVHYFVSDTGIGIDPSELSNIFQPFHKVSKNATKLYKGSGVGLSICKKIIDAMSGTIQIESEVGNGTIVRFTTPVEPKLDKSIV